MHRASAQGPLSANRRVWSTQEDEAIRTLVEKHGTSNWTFIADSLLALECSTPGRSGKQCWERWHNHLGETRLLLLLLLLYLSGSVGIRWSLSDVYALHAQYELYAQ